MHERSRAISAANSLKPSTSLLLFGATGDLAKRMLLPSLFALHEDELIDADLRITGTARSELDDKGFRDFAKEALEEYLPEDRRDSGSIASFLERLQYQPLDASTLEGFDDLAAKLGDISGGLSIFLSTAPFLFEPTIKGLKHSGLTGTRPHRPGEAARQRSRQLCRHQRRGCQRLDEDQIFRIDHYRARRRSRT